MNRGLVIGKTNVGKTLFCIHFAKFMGIRELNWLVERTDGQTERRRMSVNAAEVELSDATPHRTRNLQSLAVEFPHKKGTHTLLLSDSTGLCDGIHPEASVREAMAQTLEVLFSARIVLHIVDAAQIGRRLMQGVGSGDAWWDPVEEQLADYGGTQSGYIILANKMDLPEARSGYAALSKRFTRHRVIPVSALYATGFREVKQHVWRFA
ncbi:hypothetical protein GCM10025857_02360 [Alicyclobacillus contaminans]|uniref:GTPase n=1 Tax=Alicyclobacillus contaminans TaxID=392016 RepID=UPI0004011088|nr:GTPase [Alicyclobacillus contaminans]GMA48879.1 hypothetical protein GCM10025857_02360 [Alicyclobacillus contaminans]